MSGPFLTYQTIQGDRWDSIAWRFYGDPFAYQILLEANVPVAAQPVLDGGIWLTVPVVQNNDIQPSGTPW